MLCLYIPGFRLAVHRRREPELAGDGGVGPERTAGAIGGEMQEEQHRHLLEAQVAELVRIARDEPDLVLRTAASQALGAVNLASNQASDIIRRYYGG